MAQWSVTVELSREVYQNGVLVVEADTEDAAYDVAMQLIESGESGLPEVKGVLDLMMSAERLDTPVDFWLNW